MKILFIPIIIIYIFTMAKLLQNIHISNKKALKEKKNKKRQAQSIQLIYIFLKFTAEIT